MVDLVLDPSQLVDDMGLAKRVGEALHKHYPGHLWAVTCEGEKGIATVRNMMLSGNWGFILKLTDVYDDPGMKRVIRAGGEILERFRVSRAKVNHERIEELPTLPSGMPVFDPAAAKTKVPKIITESWNKHH